MSKKNTDSRQLGLYEHPNYRDLWISFFYQKIEYGKYLNLNLGLFLLKEQILFLNDFNSDFWRR